jgi:hypothetical protein
VTDKSVFGLAGEGDGPVLQAQLKNAKGTPIELDNLVRILGIISLRL